VPLLGYFLLISLQRAAVRLSDFLTVLYTGAGPLCGYCIPCPRLITSDDNRMEAWLTQCCNARCGVRCLSYRVPSNSSLGTAVLTSLGGWEEATHPRSAVVSGWRVMSLAVLNPLLTNICTTCSCDEQLCILHTDCVYRFCVSSIQ